MPHPRAHHLLDVDSFFETETGRAEAAASILEDDFRLLSALHVVLVVLHVKTGIDFNMTSLEK